MARKSLPFYEHVTIEDIAAEGKSIVRIDDVVVFVQGAIPGDVVDLQVTRKRKRFREARVTRYISYSDLRVTPVCSHFGICGGCKWQHLPYSEQLRYKEKQVRDALKRIGKIEVESPEAILGSAQTEYYRNKLEFTFSNHRWLTETETSSEDILEHRNGLGFHVPGRFDRVVDIEKCYLQVEPSNEIRNLVRDFALQKDLTFYDHKTNEGFLRNLIIRTSSTGELMIVLAVQYDQPELYKLLDLMNEKISGITSLMYVINEKKNDTLYDQDIILYKGRDHIIEEMEGLRFKIGPKSFFQTNTQQSLNLYKIAREYAGLTGEETVYDLYTGTGTIAAFVAASAAKVVGIDSVPEAIEDARINAEINGILNTVFHAGDMKDLFTEDFILENGRPDVIITDPPRAGMHGSVVNEILKVEPLRIVYVSCNPATQARDVELLSVKYKALRSRAVDMFPHTHHIENVLLLVKKD